MMLRENTPVVEQQDLVHQPFWVQKHLSIPVHDCVPCQQVVPVGKRLAEGVDECAGLVHFQQLLITFFHHPFVEVLPFPLPALLLLYLNLFYVPQGVAGQADIVDCGGALPAFHALYFSHFIRFCRDFLEKRVNYKINFILQCPVAKIIAPSHFTINYEESKLCIVHG